MITLTESILSKKKLSPEDIIQSVLSDCFSDFYRGGVQDVVIGLQGDGIKISSKKYLEFELDLDQWGKLDLPKDIYFDGDFKVGFLGDKIMDYTFHNSFKSTDPKVEFYISLSHHQIIKNCTFDGKFLLKPHNPDYEKFEIDMNFMGDYDGGKFNNSFISRWVDWSNMVYKDNKFTKNTPPQTYVFISVDGMEYSEIDGVKYKFLDKLSSKIKFSEDYLDNIIVEIFT